MNECSKKGCLEPRLPNQYLCEYHKSVANTNYNARRKLKRAMAKAARRRDEVRSIYTCCVCEKEKLPLILLTKKKGVCWGCYPTYTDAPF